MLKIILLSAFRSLRKYRQMSLINLLGLVAGLTSFLFIIHYVVYEYSFDSFFRQPGNVYRVNWEVTREGETLYKGAKSPRGLFYAVKEEIPEVEAAGCAYFEKCQVLYENTYFANQDFLWVSEDFENVFPLEMIDGVADYSRPRAGTISETAAKALFHDQNPVGKIMEVNGEMPIEITGVFKDLPSNTHLTAQYFVSYETWVEMGAIRNRADWRYGGWWNYIRLKQGASPEHVLARINGFNEKYMGFLANDNRVSEFTLQPLRDLHFIRGIEGEMGAATNHSSLINLVIIALFTLFIAWINYVNLLTAHNQSRALQIKMRKLIGASDWHIWHQSLAESLLINLSALVISFLIYKTFLNFFAKIFSIPLQQAFVPSGYIILIMMGVVILGVFFSSLYYGFDLARTSIRSEKQKGRGGHFKQGLVVVQMALSILFLISTIMVYRQVTFMKNKDLGIELDGVIILTGPASLNPDPQKRQKYQAFKNELLTYAGIESVTFNMFVPGIEPSTLGHSGFLNPSAGADPGILFYENNADEGFLNTYRIKLLAGKNFEQAAELNFRKVIVNETSLRHLGFTTPDAAVGSWIYRRGGDTTRLEVIGVVADFHNEGLQKPIYPIVWSNGYPREFGYFAVRVNTNNVHESVRTMKTVWERHYTKDAFDYAFADRQFNLQYTSEYRYSRFYLWLTVLSIAISTIGLFGLIVFYLAKRHKEIALRKVSGASIAEVIFLLNRDFIRWVGLAFVIACPVAWYAMNNWLQHFAFRTSLSWWIFLVAGLTVLFIAVFTVSWQSWRAATRNPVESLRYE